MNELVDNKVINSSLIKTIDLGLGCAGFFSMHKAPFTHTPIKSRIFPHQSYRHVKNTLMFALTSGEKLIKITGQIGIGKTLLINDVLSTIDHQFYAIKIFNPKISAKNLLCQIIDEFGLPYPADANVEQLMRLLRFSLHDHYTKIDANIIVWLDDAHLLPENTLLLINKMGEWATPSRPLIQFIMSGSTDLDKKISQPQLSSLKNNIRFSDQLMPMHKEELESYLESYIQSIEKLNEPQFTPKALTNLYRYSHGNPSWVNKLTYQALLQGFGKGQRTITHHFVKAAAQELDLFSSTKQEKTKWPWIIFSLICLNGILALIFTGS